MDLAALQSKESRYGIGLMSGSSCDGIDAALVRVRGAGKDIHMKLEAFETYAYPPAFRTRLLAPHKDVHEACILNFDLGDRLADAAQAMVERARQQDIHVDFIASHGHTIAHVPPKADKRGTIQLGEAAVIAERTKLPVISDFRPADMAAGGQGAPLVPFADWLLFHRDDRSVICLNIGGIANVTVVTPELEDVIAFDTGPGNMAIDGAARLLTHGEKDMDEGGAMAADGQVVDEFLEYLLGREYFQQPPPKSTGREEFGTEIYLRDAIAARSGSHPPEDLMATATYAVARSILDACERFILPHHDVQRLIIGGGGAHNDCLVSMLREGFREMAPETVVRLTDEYGLPADAREAVAFALLGHETLCGRPSNVPRATGAAHPAVLGKITLFP